MMMYLLKLWKSTGSWFLQHLHCPGLLVYRGSDEVTCRQGGDGKRPRSAYSQVPEGAHLGSVKPSCPPL